MIDAKPPCAPLPETDAYVHLSLLDGGSFVGEIGKVHAGVTNGKFRMYNWAFYIEHRGRHMIWDLGLEEVRLGPCEPSIMWILADIVGSLLLHALGKSIHAR